MDFSDYKDYCSQEVANELRELGFSLKNDDVVEDPSRILLEQAKYFLLHEFDARYYQIWNNEKGNYSYTVDIPSKGVKLEANDFNLSSDTLAHAISAVIDFVK